MGKTMSETNMAEHKAAEKLATPASDAERQRGGFPPAASSNADHVVRQTGETVTVIKQPDKPGAGDWKQRPLAPPPMTEKQIEMAFNHERRSRFERGR